MVVFPPIFVVDIKIILVYNSVAPLKPFVFNNSIKNEKFILLKNDEVTVNELIEQNEKNDWAEWNEQNW